jgi:molybdate transport repressor ModE-like protein
LTFAQLQAFAHVARLGSVSAAARELGISAPAVSEAVAALRRDFGDDLVVRTGHGVALTPGGRRLATAAAEILGLADQARRAVGETRGEATLLRVAATSAVAEHAAPTLLDAFAARSPGVELSLLVERGTSFGSLLTDRLADVTLGPRPTADAAIETVPFLRYRLVVVAHPEHRLAPGRRVAPTALSGERWLVGPAGADPDTAVGSFLRHKRVSPGEVRAFPSHAAARAAAAAGRGVMLAIAHTVVDELRRGALVRLDVAGTPLEGLWHASALAGDRPPPAAQALRRFVTTPEATQAMLSRPGDVPAGRFRPPVYVTLWEALGEG